MLLAHPDDELMCLPLFLEPDKSFFVFFLCTQNHFGNQRFQEAKSSVDKLKSQGIDISLISSPVMFIDGYGYRSLGQEMIHPLVDLIEKLGVSSLITFAYEGGHQDHDLCNVIGLYTHTRLGLPVTYFSGYRSTGFSLTFSFMDPLVKNNRSEKQIFLLLKFSVILLSVYRKQWRTWVFLAPVLFVKYAFRPWYKSEGNLIHDGIVKHFLYELRGKANHQEVESRFETFLTGEI